MNKSLLTVLALSSAMLLASCQPTPAASSGAPEGDGSGTSAQSSADLTPMTLEAFFEKLDGHNVTAKIDGYFDGYFVSDELIALDYGDDGFESYAKVEGKGIAYFTDNEAGDIVFGGFITPNDQVKIQDDIVYAPAYLLEAEDAWTKSTSAAGTYVLQDIESFAAGIVSLVGYNSDSAQYIASVKLKLEAEVANLEVTFNDGYGGTVKETLVMSDFGTTAYELPAAALEEAKGFTKTGWDAEEVSFLEYYYFGTGNASKFPFAGNFSEYVSWDLTYFEDYGMAYLMDANPVKSIEELITSLKGLNVGWRESEYGAEYNDLSKADAKVWSLELPLAEGSNEVVVIMITEVSAAAAGATMYPNGMLSIALMAYEYPIEGLDAINAALANVTIDVTSTSDVMFVAFPEAEVVTNALYQDATESYEYYMQMMLYFYYGVELPDGVFVFEYYHSVEFKFADADQGIAYLDAYKDSLVVLGFCAFDEEGYVITPTPTVAAEGSVILYSTDDLTSIAIGYEADEETGEVIYYVEISRYTQDYVDYINSL